MWISVNLDVGSNFCEFSHILAGSRMQPPDGCQILASSRMQPASRQQVTVGVAYVSVTGVN
jgi:hypothetical protein